MATDDDKPLHFAPTSLHEQEVVVRFDRSSGMAYVSSCWPMWTARFLKRYGRPQRLNLSPRDGKVTCAVWEIPIRLITFRKPSRPGPRNPAGLAKARKARWAGRPIRESLKTP